MYRGLHDYNDITSGRTTRVRRCVVGTSGTGRRLFGCHETMDEEVRIRWRILVRIFWYVIFCVGVYITSFFIFVDKSHKQPSSTEILPHTRVGGTVWDEARCVRIASVKHDAPRYRQFSEVITAQTDCGSVRYFIKVMFSGKPNSGTKTMFLISANNTKLIYFLKVSHGQRVFAGFSLKIILFSVGYNI